MALGWQAQSSTHPRRYRRLSPRITTHARMIHPAPSSRSPACFSQARSAQCDIRHLHNNASCAHSSNACCSARRHRLPGIETTHTEVGAMGCPSSCPTDAVRGSRALGRRRVRCRVSRTRRECVVCCQCVYNRARFLGCIGGNSGFINGLLSIPRSTAASKICRVGRYTARRPGLGTCKLFLSCSAVWERQPIAVDRCYDARRPKGQAAARGTRAIAGPAG